MQQEQNGCEKLWKPFLETNKGSRLHKNSGIYSEPESIIAVKLFLVKKNRK